MTPDWRVLAAAVLAGILLLGLACYRRWNAERGMSARWLREQDQHESRIEFHGVAMKFPIEKD